LTKKIFLAIISPKFAQSVDFKIFKSLKPIDTIQRAGFQLAPLGDLSANPVLCYSGFSTAGIEMGFKVLNADISHAYIISR
jgi:hypothetical protein